jgi:predicted PurR-regulated permease PerM
MLERRGIPRGAAVLLVQFAVVAVLLALAWFVVPPLVNQGELRQHLPSYSDRFHGLRRIT